MISPALNHELRMIRQAILRRRTLSGHFIALKNLPFWAVFVRNLFRDNKLKPTSLVKQNAILTKTISNLHALTSRQSAIVGILDFSSVAGLQEYASNEKEDRLQKLFDQEKSDKGSHHGYHKIYQPILDKLLAMQNQLLILEIGIGTNNLDTKSNMGHKGVPGASLRAFRNYDSRISIIGADIDSRILFEEDRISTFYVNQEEPESLNSLCSNFSGCRLLIDDGLHNLESNTNSYLAFIHAAQPGSYLIIEDIEFSDTTLAVWQVISELLAHKANSFLVKTKKCLIFVSEIR